MTNTERKVFKMVAHLEEQVDLVIFSASSVEEEHKKKLDQEKPSQSSLKFKSPLMKFIMDV